MATEPKIAIVHDWLTNLGGAERVVEAMLEAYPSADLYTSVYRAGSIPDLNHRVQTTFLQHWPLASRKHQLYPVLRPLAFESLDLSRYDAVISSSSAEAKGVITPTETIHISYIHTPTRYYWSHYEEYRAQPGLGVLNPLARRLLPRFVQKRRRWDFAAAQRPDLLLANSQNVRRRIEQYYQRPSTVLHPPVDIARFSKLKATAGDYYLVVSRLIPYKRVDLAVAACNKLRRRLIIVGDGPERSRLAQLAGPTVQLVGALSDHETTKLYAGMRGFIFTAEEDFGITPLEAMAAGKPVVCYGKGGALETVIDNVTGTYFAQQDVSSLTAAMLKHEAREFRTTVIKRQAAKFSKERFIAALRTVVTENL